MSGTESPRLQKWAAYHIWCADYKPPHHQKCICVCPHREWFLFINSNPPIGRRARQFAIAVANFEASFLTNPESYIYPAMRTFPDDRVAKSISDPRNCFGLISPSLIERIKSMIRENPTLKDEQKNIIINDVPIRP